MKTLDQILQAVNDGTLESHAIDGRDFSRLTEYFPVSEWHTFGFKLTDGAEAPEVKPFSLETVTQALREDLEFAFSKARSGKGISASAMYHTIKMWMWVLDDPLATWGDYGSYGLPFFQAVAKKYNMPESD